MKNKKIRLLLLVFLLSLCVFILGNIVREKVFCSQDEDSLKLFAEVLREVEVNCIDDVDAEKLVFNGVSGMLSKLDPHSAIFDKEATKYLKEEQEGSFFGIGIQFEIIEDKITVIALIEGTPAFKAGLMAGDRIVKINGENAIGISQQDVLLKLKGPKGTSVNISVEREGVKDLMEYTLIRDKIPSVSVPYSFMLNDEIGYLRITKFSQTTTTEVEDALSKLEDKKMTGLIIDLRSNVGGLLDQAIAVSNMFIEEDKEIVSTRGRVKGSNHSFKSKGKFTHPFYPIIVLVNDGTASGAEILAGAIQDHDRGLILGTRTFGKGLVQNVHSLPMGCSLILTTQKYYTPSGRCIQKPYEEYIKIFREDEGEEKPKESNVNKEIFYTDMKREVYGGGGIMPDVIFKYPKYGDAFKTIFLNELFSTFGMHYVAKNKDLLSNFKVDDKVLDEFQKFINEKKVDVKIKDLGDDLEEAKRWLERVILTAIYGSEKSAEYWMKNDPEVLQAIEIMPESRSLLAKRIEFTGKSK